MAFNYKGSNLQENLKCDSSNNLESQKDFEGQETNCHLTCDMETNSFNDMKEIVQGENI